MLKYTRRKQIQIGFGIIILIIFVLISKLIIENLTP